jgi:hypothetical protein
MSTTTHTPVTVTTPATDQPRLWTGAVKFGLVAAAATTVVAAVAHASGISLDLGGEPIPLFAFAQLTFVFSMVGLAIAAGLRRWAGNPRQAWVRTTVVLTALSLIPDLMADAAVSTRLVLMTTHLVAAAIVVPAIASRLSRR